MSLDSVEANARFPYSFTVLAFFFLAVGVRLGGLGKKN